MRFPLTICVSRVGGTAAQQGRSHAIGRYGSRYHKSSCCRLGISMRREHLPWVLYTHGLTCELKCWSTVGMSRTGGMNEEIDMDAPYRDRHHPSPSLHPPTDRLVGGERKKQSHMFTASSCSQTLRGWFSSVASAGAASTERRNVRVWSGGRYHPALSSPLGRSSGAGSEDRDAGTRDR